MTPCKTFVLTVVPFVLLLNSVSAFINVGQSVIARKMVESSESYGETASPTPSATQLHLTTLANAVVEMQEVVTPLTLAISATVLSYQMDKDPDFFATKLQSKAKATEPTGTMDAIEDEAEMSTTGTLAVGSSASAATMGTMDATAELDSEETEGVEEKSDESEEVERISVMKHARKVVLAPGRFLVNRIRGRKTSSA